MPRDGMTVNGNCVFSEFIVAHYPSITMGANPVFWERSDPEEFSRLATLLNQPRFGQIDDGLSLFAGDAFKILQEIVKRDAVTQVFEQAAHGYPRALEHGFPAEPGGVGYDIVGELRGACQFCWVHRDNPFPLNITDPILRGRPPLFRFTIV